jgi:hypothetical protein
VLSPLKDLSGAPDLAAAADLLPALASADLDGGMAAMYTTFFEGHVQGQYQQAAAGGPSGTGASAALAQAAAAGGQAAAADADELPVPLLPEDLVQGLGLGQLAQGQLGGGEAGHGGRLQPVLTQQAGDPFGYSYLDYFVAQQQGGK